MHVVEARVHFTRDATFFDIEVLRRTVECNYIFPSLGCEVCSGTKHTPRHVNLVGVGPSVAKPGALIFCEFDCGQQDACNDALLCNAAVYFPYSGIDAEDYVRVIFKTNSPDEDDHYEQNEIDSFLVKVNMVWGSRNSLFYNKTCVIPINTPSVNKDATC